jgi:uncharacterized membrane protein
MSIVPGDLFLMDSNRGEHPQDADSDDEEDVKPARPRSPERAGIEPSKKRSTRKSPSLAGRGTDTGIVPAGTTLYFDLNFNIASALCYFPVLGVAAILWLMTEKNDNKYLKFHSVQSLVLMVGLVAFNVIVGTIKAIFGFIPVIGDSMGLILSLVQALAGFIFLGLCFRLAYSVFKGKEGRVPVLADFSDRIVESYL